MKGFAVYYIESNVVCILVFAILLIHNHFSIDRQEKQIKFDRALLAFILYFLTDCFWAAIVGGLIPKTRFQVVLNDLLFVVFMAAIAYFWLEYIMACEQVPHRNRKINRFAVIFPFLVSTVALILNYLFAPQTLINEALDTLTAYYIYLISVPCIYLIAILFYSLRKARCEESLQEKRKYLFIGFMPLMAMIGGLVETLFFPNIPIFCFSAMILMLLFYVQSTELRISLDPLTQLNNRGQLTRYISQKSNFSQEGRLTAVVMMDIDGFKAINDQYGHAEGDKALVIISDALRKAVNRHSMPSFLGRYGGDEFILILHPVSGEEIGRLICEIQTEIEQAAGEMPCPLSVSVGCDALADGQDSIQSCILRADRKLYDEKASRNLRPDHAAAG